MKIKKKGIISDLFWSFFQRGGSLVISFIANMILARLLTPDDFGCVGIILIFVSFADLLVDSGLGGALVQKKEIVQKDFDTVFTTNFLVSVFLYLAIFLIAPFVSVYFGIPDLDLYLRVLSISILIRAFYVVQCSDLFKRLRFKELSINGIIATVGSTGVAVYMAIKGFGVWSLIAKNMLQPIFTCILYRICSPVKCSFVFDKDSFKQLFGFGWFVTLTGFLDLLYSNAVAFIVGKRYTVKDLGFYNQANSLQQIPTYSLSLVINQVLFPHLARVHEDRNLIKEYSRRVMIISAFVIFPLMFYLICFAKPIIVILYSTKWLPSAIFFQILCISGIVSPMTHINRQILKAIGETKLLFRTQLLVILIGIVFLLVAQKFSIIALTWSLALCSFVNWIVLAIFTGKRIGYLFINQIKDIIPSFVISVFSIALIRFIMNYLDFGSIVTIVISCILFVILYLSVSYLFKTKGLLMAYAMCFANSKKER